MRKLCLLVLFILGVQTTTGSLLPAHTITVNLPVFFTARAYYYHAVPGQTDRDPFTTADGSRITNRYKTPRWIALSRDLMAQGFAYGDTVAIEGLGNWVVRDKMNKRYRRSIDFLVSCNRRMVLPDSIKIIRYTIRKIEICR